MTTSPACNELQAAIALDRDIPRSTFETRLQPIGKEAGGWVLDTRCRDCGQRWWVEEQDGRTQSFAIKAPPDGPWNQPLVRAAKIEYLRRSHGEERTTRCMWRECQSLALKGSAHCAEHAYDIMGVHV